MLTTNRNITALQFTVMVIAAYMGLGIFQFPRELVNAAGPDAWYAYLLECLGAFVGMKLWLAVIRTHPGEPMSEWAPKYLGAGRWFFLAITITVHVGLIVVVTSNFGFVLRTFFLPDTASWTVRLCVELVAVYLCWFDTVPLGRTVQMIMIPTVLLSLIMAGLLASHINSAYALAPGSRIQPVAILDAAWKGFYIFFGFEIVLNLLPFVKPDERKRATKLVQYAMVGTFFFFANGFLLTMGTEGPQLLEHAQWPSVSAMRLITVSAFIINKLGLLIVVLWGLFVLSFVSLRLWCLAHDALHAVERFSYTSYRGLLLGFAAISFGWGTAFSNVVQLTLFVERYALPALIVYLYMTPLVFLLLMRLKGHPNAPPHPSAPEASEA